jgi:hypothetical protein
MLTKVFFVFLIIVGVLFLGIIFPLLWITIKIWIKKRFSKKKSLNIDLRRTESADRYDYVDIVDMEDPGTQ